MEVENYKNQEPNPTIMIRGLSHDVTEEQILNEISSCNLVSTDIRIIRKKGSGASRGFAFVEFATSADATQWMELRQGKLAFSDKCTAVMQYSKPKDDDLPTEELGQGHVQPMMDWFCNKCCTHNFTRRDFCYKCHSARSDTSSSIGDGSDEVRNFLTKRIILRNLDVLTTVQDVLEAIRQQSLDIAIKIPNIAIGKDQLTKLSSGVCYLTYDNLRDSLQAFNLLKYCQPPFTIDDRQIQVSYCKDDEEESGDNFLPNANRNYTLADIPKLAEYSAKVYSKSSLEYPKLYEYYTNYYTDLIRQGKSIWLPQNMNINNTTEASVAYTNSTSDYSKNPLKVVKKPTGTDGLTYKTPTVNLFYYDYETKYYYDPTTGLYYDPNTQYYFNNQISKYLFWNEAKSTYELAPQNCVDLFYGKSQTTESHALLPTASTSKESEEKNKKILKKEKVVIAKKITKEMERWAKTLNQKKDNFKRQMSSVLKVPSGSPVSRNTADICYSVLEKSQKVFSEDICDIFEPVPAQRQINSNSNKFIPCTTDLVNTTLSSVKTSDGNDSLENENYGIDLETMTCLICKRQFATKEYLLKHEQISELHKTNLELAKQTNKRKTETDYRDRAKERRLNCDPEPPIKNVTKEKYMSYFDLKPVPDDVVGEQNVGNMMLKKMGWTEGQGLGKSNVVINKVIDVRARTNHAGLGVPVTSGLSGDNYKLYVKKMMLPRYNEGQSRR